MKLDKDSNSITTTIRRMKIDDVACQMVMRYQLNPSCLHLDDNHHTRTVKNLAKIVWEESRYPETVGEWVSVVMLHGEDQRVRSMRENAKRAGQASYIQAERWLKLVDRAQAA